MQQRWWVVGLSGVVCVMLLLMSWEHDETMELRSLESDLYAVEQRQKALDRELLDVGSLLAPPPAPPLLAQPLTPQRVAATLRGSPQPPPQAQMAAPQMEVPSPKKRQPPPIAAALLPPATSTSQSSSWGPTWGPGPPPDVYFALGGCAARRLTGEGFFEYGQRPAGEACGRAALGLRVEPDCPSSQPKGGPRAARRQILVTGVQRSGTHFTWEMFNRLGVHAHHEGLGPAGAVSWFYSWNRKGYAINNPEPIRAQRFCVVLHQVRHPLRVISSVLKATKPTDRFWSWIYTAEPSLLKQQPFVALAARLWLRQNELIEKYADARFKVEETSPRDVCRAAGFDELLCGNDGSHHTTSSKVVQPIIEPHVASEAEVAAAREHGKVPSVTWAQLEAADADVAAEVRAMARRYGYNDDPMIHPQSLGTTTFKA